MQQEVLIYATPPPDFIAQADVAGIWCRYKNKILLLKRHPEKPQGEMWGIPAGKLEEDENPLDGAIREMYEETQVLLKKSDIKEIGTYYVEHPDLHFRYHLFYYQFLTVPELIVEEEEHTEAQWVTKEEALSMPLIGGGTELMEIVIGTFPEMP